MTDDELVALAKAVEDAKASLAAANTSTEVWTRGKALRSAREALAEACEAPAVLLSLVERVQRAEKGIERAFLAGVEHADGAEGCGAREGLAAREYAASLALAREGAL